ncbi:MAG: hypothetical protein GXO89_08260 [Chlorobi bacterium]|nr:hypothetical protein [Chlorobiota bacterium]
MENSIKIPLFVVLPLLAIFSTTVYAQHNHGNMEGGMHNMEMMQAPHGGELKKAGKYHVEMLADLLLKKNQLAFYLFKGSLKPVSLKGITGTIAFEQDDGTSRVDTLVLQGDARFVAQLKDKKAFKCKVRFLVKGKTVSADFSHKGLESSVLGNYRCPMHTDVVANEPGNCPKCGMELVLKEKEGTGNGHRHNN